MSRPAFSIEAFSNVLLDITGTSYTASVITFTRLTKACLLLYCAFLSICTHLIPCLFFHQASPYLNAERIIEKQYFLNCEINRRAAD